MHAACIRALIVVLAMAVPAGAEPPDAASIVRGMKAALEPAHPSVRRLSITVSAHHGDDALWTAGQARKRIDGRARRLMVMLSPKDVQGVSWLAHEGAPGASDEQWVYLPSIRRVRKLTGGSAYEAFLGSDFTYSDLGFETVHARYELVGTETKDGMDAFPADRWYYQRVVTLVNPRSMLPIERSYYDSTNALWKTERFEQVTTIDGIATPVRLLMEDQQTRGHTHIVMDAVRYDVDLADTLFDPAKLRDAMSSDVWRKLSD
jgi:hypothetical protein